MLRPHKVDRRVNGTIRHLRIRDVFSTAFYLSCPRSETVTALNTDCLSITVHPKFPTNIVKEFHDATCYIEPEFNLCSARAPSTRPICIYSSGDRITTATKPELLCCAVDPTTGNPATPINYFSRRRESESDMLSFVLQPANRRLITITHTISDRRLSRVIFLSIVELSLHHIPKPSSAPPPPPPPRRNLKSKKKKNPRAPRSRGLVIERYSTVKKKGCCPSRSPPSNYGTVPFSGLLPLCTRTCRFIRSVDRRGRRMNTTDLKSRVGRDPVLYPYLGLGPQSGRDRPSCAVSRTVIPRVPYCIHTTNSNFDP
jgi:hypothetical protein